MSRGSDYKPPVCRCQELEERIEDIYELYDELREKVHTNKNQLKSVESDLDHVKSKVGLTPEPECITKHILNEHRWKVYDRIENKFQALKDEIHDLKIDQVRKSWSEKYEKQFKEDFKKQAMDAIMLNRNKQDDTKYKGFKRTSPYSKAPKQESECITIQRGDDKNHKVYLSAGDTVVIGGREISFKRTDEGQLICDHTAYNPTSEFTVLEEPDYLQVGDQWRDEEGNEYVLSMIDVEEDDEDNTQYFFLVNKQTGATVGRIVDIHKMTYFYNCSRVRLHLGITDSMTKIK